MILLFTNYSSREVVLFIIILAIGIKNLILFIDWAKKRTKQAVLENNIPALLACTTQRHEEELGDIRKQLVSIKLAVNLLISSDKDDIKQSLTKDHHYFCYKLKSIDDYSLDCMEKRYSHYKDEGGNSFVKILMLEVRALPRKIETENR